VTTHYCGPGPGYDEFTSGRGVNWNVRKEKESQRDSWRGPCAAAARPRSNFGRGLSKVLGTFGTPIEVLAKPSLYKLGTRRLEPARRPEAQRSSGGKAILAIGTGDRSLQCMQC
jgi:hypothetical protein